MEAEKAEKTLYNISVGICAIGLVSLFVGYKAGILGMMITGVVLAIIGLVSGMVCEGMGCE